MQVLNAPTDMTELRAIQLTELDILKVIDKICSKHKLNYWLTDGTLLGAKRHGGFIPWDDDIDLCIMRDEYKTLVEILPEALPKGYKMIIKGNPDSEMNRKSPWLTGVTIEKNGYPGFVDFFPIDKSFHSRFMGELQQKLYKYLVLPFRLEPLRGVKKLRSFTAKLVSFFIAPEVLEQKIFNMYTMSKNQRFRYSLSDSKFAHYFDEAQIFPLSKIEFEKIKFPAPAQVHEYLVEIYGPDYMTPPPEKKRRPMHT